MYHLGMIRDENTLWAIAETEKVYEGVFLCIHESKWWPFFLSDPSVCLKMVVTCVLYFIHYMLALLQQSEQRRANYSRTSRAATGTPESLQLRVCVIQRTGETTDFSTGSGIATRTNSWTVSHDLLPIKTQSSGQLQFLYTILIPLTHPAAQGAQ